MTTERWISAYTKNKNHSDQYLFQDGSWTYFMRGVYDGRDIMSDCVKPSWESSGEYMICLVPANRRHSSDHDFAVYTDKNWANRIVYNLQQGRFHTAEELKKALRAEGEKQGTYKKTYGICKETVTLKGEN